MEKIMTTRLILSLFRATRLGFLTALGVLLFNSSPSHADTVRYLARGDQAFMQMAELIKNARTTLDLTYYIFDPCNATTKALLDAMIKRAQSGVKVRILMDAYTHNKELQQKLRASLSKNGIELRYYNFVGVNPHLNYRSHAKVMLADGQRYISGGRNIADDYFSVAENRNFIDRDIYVEGPSAGQAQSKFDAFWSHKMTYVPGSSTAERVDDLEKNCMQIDQKTKTLIAAIEAETPTILEQTTVHSCENVKFTMDDPAFWNLSSASNHSVWETQHMNAWDAEELKVQRKETTKEILDFLREPIQQLVLENWSYIPSLTFDTIFKDLRSKNIPIIVVTNNESDEGSSVEIINKHYTERDNTGSQKIMTLNLAGSVKSAWSQTPSNAFWMLHSKVFVSNASNVAVTSFNLDPRSFHTNLETGVFIRNCPGFAAHVLDEIQILTEAYNRDKDCERCQKQKDRSVTETIKAWLSHELL